MSGPIEVRLHGSRLDHEEALPLELSADIIWRVVAPAWQTVWWDRELATSPYSTELIGPAMGPLWDDHPFADVSDALYRIAYGRSLEVWIVLFHAGSGERFQMTAEVFRIEMDRGLIEWRVREAGEPPTLTITAKGTHSDWLGQLPALARTAQRIFRPSSRRGRPPGTRLRTDAEVTQAEERLRRAGRSPTAEAMAEELRVDVSTYKRWRKGL